MRGWAGATSPVQGMLRLPSHAFDNVVIKKVSATDHAPFALDR